MKFLKKGFKLFFKTLFIIVMLFFTLRALYLLTIDFVTGASLYSYGEYIYAPASDFLAKHGDRHTAYDMVFFMKEQTDQRWRAVFGQEEAFFAMIKKYPENEELYLAAIVEGIFDSETKHYNRIQLVRVFEMVTGEYSGYFGYGEKRIYEFEKARPYLELGMRNVAEWWAQHLKEQAEEAIAAMEPDYFFTPAATGTAAVESGPDIH